MSEWSIRGSPAADLCLSARRRWVFFAQVRKSRASATLIPSPLATEFAGRCCSLARSSTARIFRPEKSATLDRAAQALKGTKKGSSFAFLNGNRAVFEAARAHPRGLGTRSPAALGLRPPRPESRICTVAAFASPASPSSFFGPREGQKIAAARVLKGIKKVSSFVCIRAF